MNLAYGRQNGLHQNVYVICNFSLNNISKIFTSIFFMKLQVSFVLRFPCLEKLNDVVSL